MSYYQSIKFFVFVLISQMGFSQTLVINELDCDTPGIDNMEFVELKSSLPNFALDGYVLVFFNGSANGGNTSYLALDLDGYTTDVNGIFLIGSNTVSPFPQYIIPENTIQNGADAVAIYRADVENFPEGIVAYVDNTLVDVLLYGTNDADALAMIEIFKAFNPLIQQINEGNANNTNSIQRNNDGSYFTGVPTPRKPNDGSGISIIGIRTIIEKANYTEGESIQLTFTTEQAVSENLNISFTLSNGTFNTGDFNGNTQLVIVQGSTSVSTTIIVVDDIVDEGDEEMILRLLPLPSQFLALNNNIRIRVIDNDFKVAGFGTPINPTHGKIKSNQRPDYYQSINGKSGHELKTALQAIIADPNIVRAQTYNDVIDILKEADQNPENSNQVWLVYLEKGRAKLDFQLNSDNFNTWNREHTWPRSRGGFNSIEADETFNGKDIFWITSPDSIRHANSDAHAIRAVDGPENSSRGNQFYGQYQGPANSKGGFKGDVARGVFYLAVRYNGLDLVSGYPEGMIGKFGDLDTLLAWHRRDKVDDYEINRNNVVETWQYNRNPFIDMPELVEYIWGSKQGQTWQNPTSVATHFSDPIMIYPNPSNGHFFISGIKENTKIEILRPDGNVCGHYYTDEKIEIQNELHPGLYFIKLTNQVGVTTLSIMIK
ncbi:MAG: endonuclease [Saprospiraceae bacterium]|nr:endonuclease [Saprospiraceae bacterium]